jgi:hypothetical protein
VAARTILVAGVACDASGFRRVAPTAQSEIGFGERESVRLVTLGAGHTSVKGRVSVRRLVAAAAGFCAFMGAGHARGRGSRMRVVTADTAAAWTKLGVVWMNIRVATNARLLWGAANVVRRVAAGALIVSRDAGCAEHVELGVAGAARFARAFAEVMRLVAIDAFAVAVGK